MTRQTSTSHRRVDGRYQNPPGSPERSAGLKDILSFLYRQLFKTKAPIVPPSHVVRSDMVQDQLQQIGNPSITWLGHASFLIRMGGKTLLTDPFLSETAGIAGFGPKRFVPAALSVDQLPFIDVLLISHNHYDHLDASAIEAYPHKTETQVVVPLGLSPFFTKRGYTKVVELDWWQDWSGLGLKITALPAIHFSSRGLFDRDKTLWASYAIETEDGKIWFSGDTAYSRIFEEIGETVGPFDYAIVGIGAYEPRAIMQSVHATPEEGVAIAKAVGAKKAIGMHWGTIMLTPEDPFEAPERFRQAAEQQDFGRDNAVIMAIGESLKL